MLDIGIGINEVEILVTEGGSWFICWYLQIFLRYKLSFLFGKSVSTTRMPIRGADFKNSTSAKLD